MHLNSLAIQEHAGRHFKADTMLALIRGVLVLVPRDLQRWVHSRSYGIVARPELHSCVKRRAILLVAGDKSGVSERRFYQRFIRKADERFDAHLARLGSQRS